MSKKRCVAMLLAGGQGTRLGKLTTRLAKPAVPFGGKYRIIDFTLSNCSNSGIDTVGVLTQYQPYILNSYIGIGSSWDLDRKNGGVSVLPPYMGQKGGEWYRGTANAIYQNMYYIKQYDPEYVLVISGDHIYKMDYSEMLDYHEQRNADATIAVLEVPWHEASRFGIMNTDDEDRIVEFQEKPAEPKTNLASMGIYIFNWKALEKYLTEDEQKSDSSNDFGKDIIPAMIEDEKNVFAYSFNGYWKDVGTLQSLWEANMDLLDDDPSLILNDPAWKIYSVNPNQPPQYIAPQAKVTRSLVNEGCVVYGEVYRSVLFYGVHVGLGSTIKNSIIMPNVKIGANVTIENAIVESGTVVEDGMTLGSSDGSISLIADGEIVSVPK
ncbi:MULTISPECIES: glucose-1-phosphate adenylyltransferase [Bacillales]|uniref:glucose-1-phosphate adenylyltransferase n=1 Tax=Bacillales TaxID=1385 RepID=UPI0018841659|nr:MULTISPECIES: glucose-1-phosphate adenylyltransferase [Bacillaceae]MBF0708598.1 glucose-1-phosphate adenylyltransferase [Pseudalkalibacillus hwajinpoensis]MDO6655788.1 glucose-1-phosphate adenylyltransferase [Anaerobacillus sp. 1_MG-2023]WLR59895.1 glucose-1-phosphate adenylyltransferase [Pseudalkalibacillus hwajinpoensis]